MVCEHCSRKVLHMDGEIDEMSDGCIFAFCSRHSLAYHNIIRFLISPAGIEYG